MSSSSSVMSLTGSSLIEGGCGTSLLLLRGSGREEDVEGRLQSSLLRVLGVDIM